MKRAYFLCLALVFIASASHAQLPTQFDVFTVTSVPMQSGLPVQLMDEGKKCVFYGTTRADVKKGFFSELFGLKDYFIDVSKFRCDDVMTEIKTISTRYEHPLSTGDKLKLPYIELIIGQDIKRIEGYIQDINKKP